MHDVALYIGWLVVLALGAACWASYFRRPLPAQSARPAMMTSELKWPVWFLRRMRCVPDGEDTHCVQAH